MPEKNTDSLWKKQKAARPKIQDAIRDFLEGEKLENALSLLSFLEKIKLSNTWISTNNWKIMYKGKEVCYIGLTRNAAKKELCSWGVNPKFGPTKYSEGLMDNERFKEIVWANVVHCKQCGIGHCDGGVPITLCGKEFKPVCYHVWISFSNPESETLDCIKKIIEIRKKNIAEEVPTTCDPSSPSPCKTVNNNRIVCRKCQRNLHPPVKRDKNNAR